MKFNFKYYYDKDDDEFEIEIEANSKKEAVLKLFDKVGICEFFGYEEGTEKGFTDDEHLELKEIINCGC